MKAAAIGRRAGLRYIYAGNLPGRVGTLEDTRCVSCSRVLISRYGYLIKMYDVTRTAAAPTARLSSRGDGTARSPSNGPAAVSACCSCVTGRFGPGVSRAEALPAHVGARPARGPGRAQRPSANRRRPPSINNDPCPSSTALRGRSAAFASPSRIAATCAASTACRRRSTSGCHDRTSCSSRRSCASPASLRRSACGESGITGGEPLLRRDLPGLIRQLATSARIEDLALTTNGVLLGELAAPLRDAGLHRITVSLDTLRADRFQALTRFDELRARAGRDRRRTCALRPRQDRFA